MLGWRQIQDLADALFVLRDAVVLTEKAADEIISLWEKLPVGFKQSRVLYPPRHKEDTAHTGRFMQKKPVHSHTQTITPGLVSLRR